MLRCGPKHRRHSPGDHRGMSSTLPFGIFAAVGGVFVLGGFVKGVVGLGLPTVAMGLLSLVMPPAEAAALLIVPSLVTNVWQIGGPGLVALVRRLGPMLIGVCAGTWIGAGWLTASSGESSATGSWATFGLGLALLGYATLGLLHWRASVKPVHERWLGPLVGASTGLVTAATGVFVIPAVPYLQALGLEKEELVRALGVSFLVSTIALAGVLGLDGAMDRSTLIGSALSLLPALVGMFAGQWLRLRVHPETFKKVFFCGLAVLGVYLTIRSAVHLM
jgi:uncharacterized membrane protein YfcA